MADKPILRFRENGRFTILMVSDFHAGRDFSPKLTAGLEKLLDTVKPDLVLLGGDQCVVQDTEEETRDYIAKMLAPITKRGLPWAHVFGNHDREQPMPLENQQRLYEQIPGCLSEAGPEELPGVGNYRLDVLSSTSDEAAYRIWALDSQRENRDFIGQFGLAENVRFVLPEPFGAGCGQGGVTFEQAAWYYGESKRLERECGRKTPAIMYFHIPPIEVNLIDRNPEQTHAIGSRRESPGCCELNSGLFMACLQRGDVKGIFFGHEHLNDFSGEYCGITLAYDGALGYNMSAHDDLRGGRVIELDEATGTFDTYNLKLIDLMGKDALRDPDYFEGGIRYFFRKLP